MKGRGEEGRVFDVYINRAAASQIRIYDASGLTLHYRYTTLNTTPTTSYRSKIFTELYVNKTHHCRNQN